MIPDLATIGPGIAPSGNIPSFVTVPPGSAGMVSRGRVPERPSCEPFPPQPVYEVARFNVTVPDEGTYCIAVFGNSGGKYSLAPGFLEDFPPAEWLLIPWSVITIHLWEGQPLLLIFAPLIVVLGAGIAFIMRLQKKRGMQFSPVHWLIVIAGLLYIGGSAMTALQVVHTISVTRYDPGIYILPRHPAPPRAHCRACRVHAFPSGVRSEDRWKPDRNRASRPAVLGGIIIGPVTAIAGGVVLLAGFVSLKRQA